MSATGSENTMQTTASMPDRPGRSSFTRLGNLLFAAPVVLGVVVAVATLAASSTEGAAPPSPELGARLFATQCAACHGADGEGIEGRGPTLEHEGEAAADFVLRTGRMPLAAPNLQPRRGPVRYSEEEIQALVAHVGLLGDGPAIPDVDTSSANLQRGMELYLLNCAACHSASGAGAPIGGGREAPDLHDATALQVGEAIVVGPGSMPVFGSLTDDDINDVATYVEDLQRQNTTAAVRFGGAGPVAEGLAAWLLGLIPLIALTRWIGRPKPGRDTSSVDGKAPTS